MVAAANDTPAAPPPVGNNPAQGGVNGAGHGSTGGGHKNNNNMAAKGDAQSKFTGNMMEMKGHVFQPRHVTKNAINTTTLWKYSLPICGKGARDGERVNGPLPTNAYPTGCH